MKRILISVLLLTFAFILASCGGQTASAPDETGCETCETGCETCDSECETCETSPETENADVASLLPEYADTIRYYDATVGYDLVVVGKDGKYGVMDYDGNLLGSMRFYTMDIEAVDESGNETKIYGYCGCVTESWIEKDGSETDKYPGEAFVASGADVYWMDGAPLMIDWDEGVVDFSYERATSYVYPRKVLGMFTNRTADVIPVRSVTSYTEAKDPNATPKATVEFASGKYALLDLRTGKLVTDFIFDGYGALGFMEGVLPVRKDGKWGYVDESGKMLTDFIYDETQTADLAEGEEEDDEGMMYSALNGYVVVRQGDAWGLIDTEGKTVYPTEYEGFSQADRQGRIWVKQDGKWRLEKLG